MTKVPPDREVGKSVEGNPAANDDYRWIKLRNLREAFNAMERIACEALEELASNPTARDGA